MWTFLSAALAAEPSDRVSVFVDAPPNLADQGGPVPWLFIKNEGSQPIEIQLFGGVPLLWLERSEAPLGGEPGGVCGNGYVPMTLAPGSNASFLLWGPSAHGPGASGDYRAVLPYAEGGAQREAFSEPFSLRYGDVAPPGWTGRAGGVVLLRAAGQRVREGIDPPPAAEVGRLLLPAVGRCLDAARERLPWLRGSFSLTVYRYRNQPAPVLYLGDSLLGDAEVNGCLGAIPPTPVDGRYDLGFAVSLSP